MEIVAQWVRTSWSKASRGGRAATRRNAVPVAFVLPLVTPPVTHTVRLNEWDGFVARESLEAAVPNSHELSLGRAGDLLYACLVASPDGAPERWPLRPSVRLAPGEWVRWQINYRFTDHSRGDWHYRLDTLNLANGEVPADAFLGTPTRFVDERESLR